MAGFFEYNDDPMGAGLLAAAQGLLTPRDHGGGLGAAFGGFGRAAAEARQRQLDAELKRLQIDASRKAQKSQRYIGAGGGLMFDTQTGSYIPLPTGMDDKDEPSSVRTYKFWRGLSPEEQSNMLDVMRGGNYTIKDLGGVPTAVAPRQAYLAGMASGGSSARGGAPLSTLPAEVSAAAQKAGAVEASRTAADVGTRSLVQAQIDLPKLEADASYTINLLGRLKNHPGMPLAVGDVLRGSAPAIYGSQADFVNLHNQVQGQAFLRAFETLKGGGQITEKEGEKATVAIARLQRAGTAKEFKAAADELEGILRGGMERSRTKAGQPQVRQSQSSTPKRLKFNPSTGDFE